MNEASKFDFEKLKVRAGGAEVAGGLSLPILDVELNGEAFEKLRERMGGTETAVLLRIKKTSDA